jgi:ADP-ribosylglycohydrolase
MDAYSPVPGSYTDRVIGCILAALCGDALGAYAEGWTAHRIQQEFANGLTEFKDCRMGLGSYTGT